MAMVVKNNMSAQRTLNTLNQNNKKLSKALSKVSSGMKIVGADDDASEYAISEKMREQIRSLDQDSQNVQNGQSLFKIAEGGIDNVVEELRTLKELAINAANDTNNDGDRLTIQKEFTQRMANINDIATETDYNTIRLLDGRFGNSETRWNGGGGEFPIIVSPAPEPTNFVGNISGNYTINKDGVYILTASADITINAKNVKIIQDNPNVTLNEVYMTGPSGGNANLWIEDLNIENSQDKNFIKFQGGNNYLNFEGTNNYSSSVGAMPSAVINVGGGLTVGGGNDGKGNFNFNVYTTYGAIIGTNADEDLSNSNIIVNSGNFKLKCSSVSQEGTLIGAGRGYGSPAAIGDIVIHGGTFKIENNSSSSPDNAMIGAGDFARVGNITINNAILDYKVMTQNDPIVGVGYNGQGGNITIKNSSIYHRSTTGAGIGTSGYGVGETIGDITIENCKLDIQTATGAGIGSGRGGHAGNITVINTKLDNVKTTGGGEVVGKGVNGTCGEVTIIDGPGSIEVPSIPAVLGIDAPLKIHHGTQANQATNFYINDMHTKSLGTRKLISDGLPSNEEDLARYDALAYDDDLQAAWLKTLDLAQNKTLDDIDVITKQNANVAIRVIDGAIDYALNEATYIGSYLQRLEFTGANITTMNENVQSAESTIRDADMAKEMTEYTKFNVLQQASQSMLAQANQNASSVLSLLQ